MTPLARACRFLWRDYDPRFLFWEVVDLSRKLFLASLVLFIDSEHGSGKMLRLVVATVVSALYLAALALAHEAGPAPELVVVAPVVAVGAALLRVLFQFRQGTWKERARGGGSEPLASRGREDVS